MGKRISADFTWNDRFVQNIFIFPRDTIVIWFKQTYAGLWQTRGRFGNFDLVLLGHMLSGSSGKKADTLSLLSHDSVLAPVTSTVNIYWFTSNASLVRTRLGIQVCAWYSKRGLINVLDKSTSNSHSLILKGRTSWCLRMTATCCIACWDDSWMCPYKSWFPRHRWCPRCVMPNSAAGATLKHGFYTYVSANVRLHSLSWPWPRGIASKQADCVT